jgi:predicted enzyme related to lactoylglutathione lyase
VARKSTIGAELGLGSASGGGVAAGAFTRDTTVRRTGAASYKADGAGGLTATGQWNVAFALGVACFVRVYFRVDSIAAAAAVAVIRFGGSAYPTVRINPADRKVQLRDPSNNLIGSASSAALVLGKWHMLELSLTIGTGATDAAEARLDGSSIASATAQTWSDTLPTNVIAGFITNPTSGVMYLDDIAINDATGTDQASWPGAERPAAGRGRLRLERQAVPLRFCDRRHAARGRHRDVRVEAPGGRHHHPGAALRGPRRGRRDGH